MCVNVNDDELELNYEGQLTLHNFLMINLDQLALKSNKVKVSQTTKFDVIKIFTYRFQYLKLILFYF